MTSRAAALTFRACVMLAMGAVTLWLFSSGDLEHILVGLVLGLLAVCGFIVPAGRLVWYVVGAACVFASVSLGLASGAFFDDAATGYCDSVFEPFKPGHLRVDDAPPGTYEQCAESRRERTPVIVVLALGGLAGLTFSLKKRRVEASTKGSVLSGMR